MKKQIIFSYFFILSYNVFLFAQVQLSPQLVSSAGKYVVNGGVSLSYSIGECITKTAYYLDSISPNFILTQGFQQSFDTSGTVTSPGIADIHIYNGLTPNNDNHNDVWFIDGISNYRDNSVKIYNRWGGRVWQTTGYGIDNNFWNGKNQNNQELPSGTYFYVIKLDDKSKEKKGWVELTK